MPYTTSQGLRIHYEVRGEGPPLVLQHGFASDLEAWRQHGYAAALSQEYQLIQIDARGHGQSDKPHDPTAYGRDLMARDVVAVLDDLGIARAHYWGYSMGGSIALFLARDGLLSRFRSLVIGGVSPYPRLDPASRELFARVGQMLEGGPEHLIAARERESGPLPAAEKARLRAYDTEALRAAHQVVIPWGTPGFIADEILPLITVPCLAYAGEADPLYAGARRSAQSIPGATFFCLPGLDHSQSFARSNLVLPPVQGFLAQVS